MCSSTVPSNELVETFFTSSTASGGAYSRSRSTCSTAARYFFPRFMASVHHTQAHASGRAFNNSFRGLDRIGVEVGHLGFGDLADLRFRDRSGGRPAGRTRPRGDAGSLLEQITRRRGLGDEGERPVVEDSDLDRNNSPGLRRRALVVLLAEPHDVDAMLSQSGPHGRSRIGFARFYLEFDDSFDLARHATASPPAGSPARPASPGRRS